MQFPIRLAYLMTINELQGQSLRFVGVNLVEDSEVFSHGQLYVGLSWATVADQVKVLLPDTVTGKGSVFQNVMYTEMSKIDWVISSSACAKRSGVWREPTVTIFIIIFLDLYLFSFIFIFRFVILFY
jgi:hypothetical protein